MAPQMGGHLRRGPQGGGEGTTRAPGGGLAGGGAGSESSAEEGGSSTPRSAVTTAQGDGDGVGEEGLRAWRAASQGGGPLCPVF